MAFLAAFHQALVEKNQTSLSEDQCKELAQPFCEESDLYEAGRIASASTALEQLQGKQLLEQDGAEKQRRLTPQARQMAGACYEFMAEYRRLVLRLSGPQQGEPLWMLPRSMIRISAHPYIPAAVSGRVDRSIRMLVDDREKNKHDRLEAFLEAAGVNLEVRQSQRRLECATRARVPMSFGSGSDIARGRLRLGGFRGPGASVGGGEEDVAGSQAVARDEAVQRPEVSTHRRRRHVECCPPSAVHFSRAGPR